MPTDTSINSLPVVPALVRLAAQVTTNQITQTAKKQCENLVTQKNNIITTQSNLDILKQRHNIDKSYFNKIADWYGNLSWWIKLGIGALSFVAAAGALAVGVLASSTGIGVLCAAVILGVYFIASFIVNNHYKLSTVRDQRFFNDVLEMEQLLDESISSINEIGRDFDISLKALANENARLAEDIETLEEQLRTLNGQVLVFSETIIQLRTTNDALSLSIQEQRDLNQRLKESLMEMNEHSVMLGGASGELSQTSRRLADSVNKMKAVDKHFEKNQVEIQYLHDAFREHLAVLMQHAEEDFKRRADLYQSFKQDDISHRAEHCMVMIRDMDETTSQSISKIDSNILEMDMCIAESSRVLKWIDTLEAARYISDCFQYKKA